MLQQMFEVTAKIWSSSPKPMFTWKRCLLPCNAADAREISGARTLKGHSGADWPIFFSRSIKSLIYNIFTYKVWTLNFYLKGQKFEVSFWRWEIPNSHVGCAACTNTYHNSLGNSFFRFPTDSERYVQQFVTFSMVFVTPPKIYCGEKTREQIGNSKIRLITYTFRAQIIISQQRN